VAKVDVVMAKTGVKFVHAAAEEHFDVGVYFEPNGHGTVLFEDKFYKLLKCAEKALKQHANANDQAPKRVSIALTRLQTLPALINQAVGDAISDMLFVEAILHLDDMTLEQWYGGLYRDLPSRQLKVHVKDRTVIQVNHNETQVVQPKQLQDALDTEMQQRTTTKTATPLPMTAATDDDDALDGTPRCFVRPSGTEDVVRIYAEGRTQTEADSLARAAAQRVHQLCGGIGDLP
jgi:phosphoacetylglucosamine mutase